MKNRIPYRVEILSTNGIIFKGGKISTTLKANVYLGSDNVTNLIEPSRFKWMRVGMNGEADLIWNAAHVGVKEVPITKDDVYQRATFLCEILDS